MTVGLILGIDEAGRGPVIGPMVVCGVEIRRSEEDHLRELGVRDSKLLTPTKRKVLAAEILKISPKHILKEIEPRRIDEAVARKGLNRLEVHIMAEIVRSLRSDTVYVDAPMINTRTFADMLRNQLAKPPEIMAENEADRKYTVVAAASILAKVRRDERIEELHETHGDFGSGYPNDQKTLRFLEDHFRRERSFPSIVRKSWATARELAATLNQRKMSEYL
ncbi:MAG: ribonuclease HII [Candidatus Geothermarchaeales archaeon]